VAAIARACNEPEIARWIHQMPSPYGEQDAHEYVLATQAGWRDGTGGFFAIVDAATAEPVGSIAIHVIDPVFGNVEVGYWTAAEARGRGLTTRALRLISLGDRGGRRARAAARGCAQHALAARRGKGRVHP
jgi:RimJ/RimL family protein N-acetyltransferase